MTTWAEFLDDYESKIDSTEVALTEGSELDPSVLTPFSAPEGLGPLPEAYVDRVVDIMRKSMEVGQRLQTAMDAIQREINRTPAGGRPKSPFSETVVPKYFNDAV